MGSRAWLEYQIRRNIADDVKQTVVARIVRNETPAGAVDGQNKSYELANPHVIGTLAVYRNGIRVGPMHWTENADGFAFADAPQPDDELIVDYQRERDEAPA